MLHSVDANTSSISLKWNSPPGLDLKYGVEWNSSKDAMSRQTDSTSTVLLGLIPGTSYTIRITAVDGDNLTGEPHTFAVVTSNLPFP